MCSGVYVFRTYPYYNTGNEVKNSVMKSSRDSLKSAMQESNAGRQQPSTADIPPLQRKPSKTSRPDSLFKTTGL